MNHLGDDGSKPAQSRGGTWSYLFRAWNPHWGFGWAAGMVWGFGLGAHNKWISVASMALVFVGIPQWLARCISRRREG